MTPGRFPRIALSAVMLAAREALGQRLGSFSAARPSAQASEPAAPAVPAEPAAEETAATAADEPTDADLPGDVPWLVRHIDRVLVTVGTIGLIAAIGFIVWEAADLTPELPRAGGPSLPFVTVLATAVLWAIYLFWKIPEWQAAGRKGQAGMGPKELFDIENAARGTIGQMLGGVAVITGLLFAWQQLGNTTETLQASHEGQLTERFTRAVDQISSDDLTVRLGGIYALEQLAHDSARNYPTVMEVVTAFVRQRAPLQGAPTSGTPTVAATGIARDVQAVLTVIGRRQASRDGPNCLDLNATNLAGANLPGANLSAVCFVRSNLSLAILRGANLTGANLTGANLRAADLSGAVLATSLLSDASLAQANFTLADLSNADLLGADLQTAVLDRAILHGANLNGADLRNALLFGADFADAELLGADLTNAVLLGANLETARHITKAQIDSAVTDATTKLPRLPTTPAT